MKFRKFGSSGTLVSEFGLGALAFGSETDQAGAHAVLDRYVELGGNYIDTADVYVKGQAEEIVGAWLAKRSDREDVVLSSKCGQYMGSGPNDGGLSAPRVRRALESSLDRLGVDFVDVYYAHCWDPLTSAEEMIQAFGGVVRDGKARYWAVSNFSGWQLERVVRLADSLGAPRPIVHQAQLSLLARQSEWELIPVARDHSMGTVAWSPLCGGWLAGNFGRDGVPTGHVRNRSLFVNELRNNPHTWRVLETLESLARGREHSVSIAQLALAWVNEAEGIACTLLGASDVDQLEDGLRASEVSLTAAERLKLDEASSLPPPEYPNTFASMLAEPRENQLL